MIVRIVFSMKDTSNAAYFGQKMVLSTKHNHLQQFCHKLNLQTVGEEELNDFL